MKCLFSGLVLISCCMLIASIAMFTFPKTLRGKRIQPKVMDVEESTKPNTKTEGKKEPTEDGLQIVEAEQAPKFKGSYFYLFKSFCNQLLIKILTMHRLPKNNKASIEKRHIDVSYCIMRAPSSACCGPLHIFTEIPRNSVPPHNARS